MKIFKNRHIKFTPETLQELMDTHELTQADLAEVLGTRQPNISAMLNGKRSITAKMTTRIYDELEWYLKPPTKSEKKALHSWYEKWAKSRPLTPSDLVSLRAHKYLFSDTDDDG